MKKKIHLSIFLCYLSFNIFQLKAYIVITNNTEGVNSNLTSSVLLVKQDSVFQNKYSKVFKEYKQENYIVTLQEALNIYDEYKFNSNRDYIFKITLLIADTYDKVNNFERALHYYKESLNQLKLINLYIDSDKSNSTHNFAKSYLRIGSTFQKMSKIDSAKNYFRKVDDLPSLNNQILYFKAASYTNLVGIYQLDSLYDKAILFANKAANIHKKTKNKISEAKTNVNLGNIYLKLNEYLKAKEIYLKGIQLIKNDNSQVAVKLKADLYYNLAWAMRNLEDYKAYDYQEMSYDIENGLRDKEIRRMVEEVSAKYNVKDIKREEENKRLKDQRTFWLFGIGSFIVMISLLYFLNLYKLKQKNLRLKLSQTQLIQNQNIEKLKSESQARILNATIDGKETERKEIAETLHDSVSALLSSANLHLMATKPLFKGDIPLEIDKTQNIIAEASQKIRDLSHTLVSSVLLKFGLNFAIKDIATKYSNSVLQIDTDISDIRRYHQDFEIKIYNIIQEFVNNILKHSKASYTLITLYEKDKNLCFQITDDGVGFDKNKVTNKDGLGLNQIEARIRMMNGKFLIESTIGEGTTISVELPVIEKS
ncbi:ATP-binding protein [Polaribacter sp.]|uniref:tetratricopeptide repeat-containing sensor histidine kinase n=1 Tax=Polaribacter sp. TaxID=1920175 RepID=UPI0035C7F794